MSVRSSALNEPKGRGFPCGTRRSPYFETAPLRSQPIPPGFPASVPAPFLQRRQMAQIDQHVTQVLASQHRPVEQDSQRQKRLIVHRRTGHADFPHPALLKIFVSNCRGRGDLETRNRAVGDAQYVIPAGKR